MITHTKATAILILFLLAIIPINAMNTNETTMAKTIYVDDNNTIGPWDGTTTHPYQHIQEAIDNATQGDTIYMYKGIYYEQIRINKTLTINGEHKNSTIIDGGYSHIVVSIIADHVTITNLTVRNSGGYMNDAGIMINTQNVTIADCIIYRTKTGIYINQTQGNLIQNCSFHNNGEGVYLRESSYTTIIETLFCHNAIGLNSQGSHHINIIGCYAHTNGIGFFLNNSSICTFSQCTAYNNNDNQGGFFLEFCHDIALSKCIADHNGFGIRTKNCSNIVITQTDILWNTHFGIKMDDAQDVLITQSTITKNMRYSIHATNSSCTLISNNIYDSLFGLYAEKSKCSAGKNWWGSIFGPAHRERLIQDRILGKKQSKITTIPFLRLSVKSAGAGWNIDETRFPVSLPTSRYQPIVIPGQDSDGDGAPDIWEEKYGYDPYVSDNHLALDPDHDGLNNIEECYMDQWGANPFKKDVFLEIDWMQSPDGLINKPSQALLTEVKQLFAENEITLHVDMGELGGGEEISYTPQFSYADLRDFYWNYFLHNDLNNPRKGIFHYAFICDKGPGAGHTFIGWDELDSFEISAQTLQEKQPSYTRDRLIVGGSVHELGHTFGLIADVYGGIDNMIDTMLFSKQYWNYRNYKSCLNYFYTYKILGYSDGTHGPGDFNDWENLDFTFFKNTQFNLPK
ncbi:MAG: right-handed parallel beta-helix repeat-containing protein [Euryarchaeota archaeon]|nr:right-handed parallel beta-helix repeat-containing protein [Euryarchaeota archaeon]